MSQPLIRHVDDSRVVRPGATLGVAVGVPIVPVYVACCREIAAEGEDEEWRVTSVCTSLGLAASAVRYSASVGERVTAVAVITVTGLLPQPGDPDPRWYCYGQVMSSGYPGTPGCSGPVVIDGTAPDLPGLRRAVEDYLSRCYPDQMAEACPHGDSGPQVDPMTGPEYDAPAAP